MVLQQETQDSQEKIENQKKRPRHQTIKLGYERALYTQLISFESDEYYSAVAKTVDEGRRLLEDGFEYVCQKDDIMLFKKRK